MTKIIWLTCMVLLMVATPTFAQKKMSKKEKKELVAITTEACAANLNSDSKYAKLVKGIEAEGYCACIMEELFNAYSLEEMAELFGSSDPKEVAKAFLKESNNQEKALACMKRNVKDEKLLKEYILNNAFGLEACVEEIEEAGLAEQIDPAGYCNCMFQKMATDFTLDQLLDPKTYDSEEFMVKAMECVLANGK